MLKSTYIDVQERLNPKQRSQLKRKLTVTKTVEQLHLNKAKVCKMTKAAGFPVLCVGD